MKTSTALDFANFHEDYLSRYISFADAKAGFSAPIAIAFIGYVISREWFAAACGSNIISSINAYATVLLIATSIGSAFWVVAPRLSKSSEGVIFWSSVQAYSNEADFRSALLAMTEDDLANARISHSYALAGVAKAKYFWLRVSIWSLGAGVVCGSVLIWFWQVVG